MARGKAGTRTRALIERAPELAQIDAVLQAAKGGEGGELVIAGPPGIGKTALLEAALARARRRELVTLSASAGELERHFPYGVVRQLFEPAVRRASEAERRRLFAGVAKVTAPLLLGEAQEPAGVRDDTAFGLTHGFYWLLVNLCERTPVLIAVDDVHWADSPSLRFLVHLSRRLDGIAAALLASARTGERGLEPALVAQLAESPRAQVVSPAALSAEGVGELLAAGLGRDAESAFASASREVTGGVPFFVHELVSALAVDEIAPTARQAKRVRELGPRTVARATLVRLGRTSADSVALARAVAVLAAQATLPRAAKLAELDDTAALVALDSLVAADLVQAGEHLAFEHPTVRATVYEELGPGERSRLHHAAALLLAEEGAELDAIAAQLLASEPLGSPEVVDQLRQAAALALARGAPEDAVAYLSRALAEGSERELRAAVAFELGTASKLAGRPGTLKHFAEAQRLARDPVLQGEAALELATTLGLTGSWDEGLAVVSQALTDLGGRESALATRLECLHAGLAGSDPRYVAELDARLPELETLAAEEGVAARSLSLLLGALQAWRGAEASAVSALIERGFGGRQPLAEGVEPWTLGQGLGALILSGQGQRAHELADVLLTEGRELGSLSGFILGTAYRGFVGARFGDLAGAEEALRAALEPAREARVSYVLFSHLWFALDVIVERSEASDLAGFVQAIELGPLASVHIGAMLLDVRGRVRGAAGDHEAGIADLREAGATFTALGLVNPNGSSWRSALALMLAGEDRDEALRLARDELEDARAVGQARAIGTALRTIGLLEDGAKGRRRLEESVEVLADSPARLEHARSLVEVGAALRRAGKRAAAREPLRGGLDIAAGGGAERLAERARTELEASGGRPRRLRSSGRDALTPSELRVAGMAAEGHTNNEIAQALFVTPKTVDTHLSHVYAKLGISSRRALAGALDSGAEDAETQRDGAGLPTRLGPRQAPPVSTTR
jgi:DNA-binding CsgD family transcriptional regulator/tetratricopeptide (TPR) repeat protein